MLTVENLKRISTENNIPEALRIIKDTDIGNFLENSHIGNFDEIDESLWRYWELCSGRVNTFLFLPEDVRNLLSAYITKYDILNIKTTLMGQLFHQNINPVPAGTIYRWGFNKRLASTKSISDIVEMLIDCDLVDYAAVLSESKIDEGLPSYRLLEAKLDTAFYKNLITVSRESKDISVLPKAFGTMVDMENLKLICRAILDGSRSQISEYLIKEYYLISARTIQEMFSQDLENLPHLLVNTPYENIMTNLAEHYKKIQDFSAIEEVLEAKKINLVRQLLSPATFVPALIIWYLIIKEIEIRNLRITLKAIIEGIQPEKIARFWVSA